MRFITKQWINTFCIFLILQKKSKNSHEFVIHLLDFKNIEDQIFIKKNLDNVPNPQIISIKNGIELSLGNKKVQITLSPNFGELLIDGKKPPEFKGESFREIVENSHAEKTAKLQHSPLHLIFLPRAEAAGPLLFAPLVYTIARTAIFQFVKTAARHTAIGAAGGAAFGCGLGGAAGSFPVYDEAENTEKLGFAKGCVDGAIALAITGGAIGAATGIPTGLAGGTVAKLPPIGSPDNISPSELKKAGLTTKDLVVLKSRFGTVASKLGVASAIAMLGYSVRQMQLANGASIVCEKNGQYKTTLMRAGTPLTDTLIEFKNSKLRLGQLEFDANQQALEDKLRSETKLSQKQIHTLSSEVIQEHQVHHNKCKKFPNSNFDVAFSDIKNLNKALRNNPAKGETK